MKRRRGYRDATHWEGGVPFDGICVGCHATLPMGTVDHECRSPRVLGERLRGCQGCMHNTRNGLHGGMCPLIKTARRGETWRNACYVPWNNASAAHGHP